MSQLKNGETGVPTHTLNVFRLNSGEPFLKCPAGSTFPITGLSFGIFRSISSISTPLLKWKAAALVATIESVIIVALPQLWYMTVIAAGIGSAHAPVFFMSSFLCSCAAEFSGSVGGTGRICRVFIRADLPAEGFCHRCAADHDLHLVADACFFCFFYHFPHHRHGGGQQCGTAYDLAVLVNCGFYIGFRFYICPKIHNLQPLAFHHHLYQILADVVQIAFYSADAYPADSFHTAFGEERL